MTMKNENLLYYDLGSHAVAFSTKRTADTGSAFDALGIDRDKLLMPKQVHGNEILKIDSDKPDNKTVAMIEADAIMTDRPGIFIGVRTADCIPVLLYDCANHAACAVHAGWRGTVKRIAGKAVKAMQKAYGTQPETLRAVIGPGISMQSFEVGEEVYRAFIEAGFTEIYHRQDKWHIDLWQANIQDLIQSGMTGSNIFLSAIDTYTSYDMFYSARREGISTGRILTGIAMYQ